MLGEMDRISPNGASQSYHVEHAPHNLNTQVTNLDKNVPIALVSSCCLLHWFQRNPLSLSRTGTDYIVQGLGFSRWGSSFQNPLSHFNGYKNNMVPSKIVGTKMGFAFCDPKYLEFNGITISHHVQSLITSNLIFYHVLFTKVDVVLI